MGQHCTGKNPMKCSPRGSRQLCIRKIFHSMLTAYAILVLCNVVPEGPSNISHEKIRQIQNIRLNSICSRSSHMYISGPSRQTKYKVIRSSTLYPATGQTFSRTLSKKVKLSASHAMLPKPMQSCLTVSVKCRDQDCISN